VAVYGGSSGKNGGGGNEFIVANAQDTLNDIHGPLAIHGGGIYDFASVVDGQNTVGHGYTLTATDVQRDDLADITYDGLSELVLSTGDNPYYGHTPPSTVNVLSTAANVLTVVATGAGDTINLGMPIANSSTKTLQDFQGPLRVQIGEYHLGSGTVVVDDSGDSSSRQVIYQNTGSGTDEITGLAGPAANPQPIYLDLGPTANVSVLGGSGNNLFQIEGGIVPGSITAGAGNDTFQIFTGAEITGTLDGGGGANTLDYSQYVGNVLVDLLAGSATATGGIAHIQQVNGSQGNDLLVGNANSSTLNGGTRRNVLIGGAGQATLDASHSTGDNILIGGRTDWDMNLAALEAIMVEWDRIDLSFADRRSDLLNGTNSQGKEPLNTIIVNGVKQLVLLTPSTNRTSSNGKVHANAYNDTLIGGTASDPATGKRLLHNWFFDALNDTIENYVNSSDKKDHIT
jgi:Ca2+-binding RTX toxin-like protein